MEKEISMKYEFTNGKVAIGKRIKHRRRTRFIDVVKVDGDKIIGKDENGRMGWWLYPDDNLYYDVPEFIERWKKRLV